MEHTKYIHRVQRLCPVKSVLLRYVFLLLLVGFNVTIYLMEKDKSSCQIANQTELFAHTFHKAHCGGLGNLRKTVLVIHYVLPNFQTVAVLRKFYEPVFGEVVFCSHIGDKELGVVQVNGSQGFECVATSMKLFPHSSGFIYARNDIVLNWWNLLNLDIDKIWIGNNIPYEKEYTYSAWKWWENGHTSSLICDIAFEKVIEMMKTTETISLELPRYLEQFFKNTNHKKICPENWPGSFYIPRQLSNTYLVLSDIYRRHIPFSQITVSTTLLFLLNKTNYYNLNEVPSRDISTPIYKSGESFFMVYNVHRKLSYPFEMGVEGGLANRNFFENIVIPYGNIMKEKCQFVYKSYIRMKQLNQLGGS